MTSTRVLTPASLKEPLSAAIQARPWTYDGIAIPTATVSGLDRLQETAIINAAAVIARLRFRRILVSQSFAATTCPMTAPL